jgi:hypothetical protein
MTIYIFTGPTLSADEARSELDAIFLPPVSQGDVYRAARRRPTAIGIIDGYFESVPAVWHKEILWAMKEGVHVYGSASLGALRAAELAPFGMEGVGTIFEAFRDGELEDDDEVALVHGPPESGYRPYSEAMVNIRRTLADATGAGVLSPATRVTLEELAKALFYPDRTYPLLLQRAHAAAPEPELEVFRQWLPQGRADQKREDALAMLRLMRERMGTHPGTKRVHYWFEHTDMWEEASSHAGDLTLHGEQGADAVLLDDVLEEVQLLDGGYARARQATLARLLALDEAQRQHMTPSSRNLKERTEGFRRQRDLLAPEEVERWLAENLLTWDDFGSLMEDEARLRWVDELTRPEVERLLPDHLRVTGEYPSLVARAIDKRRTLDRHGLQNPGLADCGLTEADLARWYFDRCGHPEIPDVSEYARRAGFRDDEAFRRALLREFCYQAKKQRPGRTTRHAGSLGALPPGR